MKKGKTISMILTIVMLVLLAGSMVKISKANGDATEPAEDKLSYDRAKGELTYGNEIVVDFSNEQYDASEGILTTLKNPKGFKMEGNSLVFTAENYNKEFDGKRVVISYDGEITFNKDGEIIAQKYKEEINLFADKSTLRITEIDENKNIKVTFETLDDDGKKDTFDLSEEQMKLYEFLPTGIPLNKYIKSEEEIENSVVVTSPDGGSKLIIKGIGKVETSSEQPAETKKETIQISVPDELISKVGEIFNNEKEGFSNVKWNSKDNKLTYTAKYDGISTNVEIVWDKYNEIKSKTYIKKLEDDRTIKTVISPQTETTKTWENDIIIYAKFREQEIEKLGELGLSDIYYDFGVLKAVKDGDTGNLENGIIFTYDVEEGSNFKRTLQLLEGGGTLEFHNKNTEEGNLDGTITITRGGAKLTFYGTVEKYKDSIKIADKDKTTLKATIDKDGNILTDYKNGEAQTIYYAKDTFDYDEYVFGRMQEDNSEKIYSAGYVPFAFRIDKDNIIIIDRQGDGTYKYILNGKEELNEENAMIKEAKAMVTKSLIGPAFYAAVEGARGGIALSNLLNSWLDIDFITNWRKKTDEFFSETVIGRIISGKWEESICHSKIEKIPENIAVVNVNNIMGFAAHVEGERSAAITTNNQTLYFYKITFGVNPYGMGNITFELLIDQNVVDLDNDGMADKIELEADETYSGTGEKAVVRHKSEIYKEVCLKFYNTKNLNAEFRNSLKDNKLCNKINEVDLSSVEISEPASSTAVSSTSTGQQGW